jgi:hypothetical protein
MPAYMGNPGGISFGPVAIGGHGFSDWAHEFGHNLQSLVLGPLYLIVIGIPSVAGAQWTETWADKWAN